MKIIRLYKEAFGGLSTASWMLSAIMLINRSGSMIIPFLGIYLTESLGFTLQEAGVMVACYGIGSIIAAYLGGWLTDKIGHFKVQFFSLVGGGSLCFVLLYMETFYSFVFTAILLSIVADSLRPANATSISYYSKPENITRSFALNRMAINLGFAIGPAVGGLLAAVSFKFLFVVDGATCILAGLVFYFYFRNRKGNENLSNSKKLGVAKKNPYRDKLFLFFILLSTMFAIVFFQLFLTFPLYFREDCGLTKAETGSLLGLNGILVFAIEMVIVHQLKDRKNILFIVVLGLLLTAISFFVLNISKSGWVLVSAIIIMSVAEILAMPFMATFTVQRSDESSRGNYMGLYTMSYSIGFVVAPFLGTTIATYWSFTTLWWILGVASIGVAFGFYLLARLLKKENLDLK